MKMESHDRLRRSLLKLPLLAALPAISSAKSLPLLSGSTQSQPTGNSMERTLLLKNAECVVCMDADRREIRNASILIKGNQIVAVGEAGSLPDSADEIIDLRGHIVIPGLINTHHHMYQSLTRAIPAVQNGELFNWLTHRNSGVLMHPTSLPGPQGCGVLDSTINDWLSFLADAGIRYWQTCPLGPTGFGDSPYQCFSVFAGNPYLIDLEPLQAAGLLQPADLAPLRDLPQDCVDFGRVYQHKWPLLFKAVQKPHFMYWQFTLAQWAYSAPVMRWAVR